MIASRPQWRVEAPTKDAVAALVSDVGVSPTVAKILVNRGIAAPAAVRRFLAPRFEHGKIPATPGLAEAVAVLSSARRSGSAVAVYGDYDVDGVAATTILRQALAAYGLRGPARPATCATGGGLFGAAEAETEPEIAFHIPRRTADGYGLNPAAVEHLAAEGVQVLVTVDCGISAAQEIDLANRLGMTVVVTDHHQPPTTLPAAAAIVNPWLNAAGGPAGCGLAGCDVDEPCGALVAFDLAQSLVAEVPDHWLDLAALATVADIVPLVGRNRDLVHDRLPQIPRTGNCGLSALLQVSGLTGKAVTARDLAFALAPRVNALGRLDLGEGARDAVRMFASRSASEALPIAEAMSLANVRRQQIEQSLTAKSLAMIEGGQTRAGEHGHLPAGLVVAGSGQEWHPGVVGIVASRLAARYWRPAAVVAVENGAGRGSVRGIPGYNIYQALVHCADLLDHFGGHAQAGGFGIDSSRLGDFAARFAQGIAQQGEIERETVIDAALTLAAIDEELVAELACLEPLGHGNPQPALASFGCEVLTARPIGAGKHLALTLRQAGTVREAVRFGLADGELEMCRPRAFVDVVFAPEINEWQDRRNLRLNLKAIRPARPCDG